MKVIKLDGKEFEYGSESHLEKLDSLHKAEVAALQKRLDEAEAEKDEATEQARKAREEADTVKSSADSERKKREADEEDKVREGVRLRRRAERLLAAAREAEESDEPTPPPAREDSPEAAKDEEEGRAKREQEDDQKMDGLSMREIKVLAIKAHRSDFDATGKSDDYVTARFDALEESVRESRTIHGVARTVHKLQHRLDKSDPASPLKLDANDPVMKAYAAQDKAARDAWKFGSKG